MCLCICCGVVLAGFEAWMRMIPNEYSFKWKYAMRHAPEIKTLVLGSSHSFYGIDTDVFEPYALNAANESQTLEYDEYFLRSHLERFTHLERVIITVSYFSLFSHRDTGPEIWRETNYRIYWHKNGLFPLRYNFELANPFPGARIIQYLKKGRKRCSQTGTGTEFNLAHRKMDWQNTGPIAAKRHTEIYNQTVFENNVNVLHAMVNMCLEKKVEVYIVTLPAWSTYRQHLDPEQLRRTVATCQEMAERTGCRYFNWLADSDFGEGEFFDADHLNEIGAEKVAHRLLKQFKMGQ